MQRQRGLVKTATNMSIIWKIELTSLYRAFVAKLPCQLSNSRCLLASRDRWKASGSHPWYCTRGSRVSGMLINVPGRVRKTGWRERVARNNDNNVFRSECPAISSPARHFSRRWGRTFISQGWLMVPARLKKRTLETQEERPTRNVKIIIRGIYQAGTFARPSRERAGFPSDAIAIHWCTLARSQRSRFLREPVRQPDIAANVPRIPGDL